LYLYKMRRSGVSEGYSRYWFCATELLCHANALEAWGPAGFRLVLPPAPLAEALNFS
jgi:hypothetical protein